MNSLVEALKRPNEVAPEVPWSVLMAKAAAEIERLQSRTQRLEGHLDWVGWDSEGVEKAKAEVERLQAERDLYELAWARLSTAEQAELRKATEAKDE